MGVTMRLRKSLLSIILRGTIALSVLGLFLPSDAHSQPPGQNLPNVIVNFEVIQVDVFYLGDVAFNLQDIMISSQTPIFFNMNVISDQPAKLMFGIDIVADTDVAQGEIELFSGLTRPENFEAGQPRYFSSRDLGKGGRLELFRAETIDINGGPPGARRIVDAIRATSRLPDGIYRFTLTVYKTETNTEPYQPRTIVGEPEHRYLRIINPTSVVLLNPMDGDRLVTQFPLFQWRSDTRDVMLHVYEMREGMRSPEEAITGIPHLETRLSDVNQFFYPQTGVGVRALEPGKQYVWFLESLYRTSANREEAIISELNTFSIIDTGKENVTNIILIELERLLEGEYGDIVSEIEQGNIKLLDRIFLDGVEITPEEFQVLIAAIRAGVNNSVIRSVSIHQQ